MPNNIEFVYRYGAYEGAGLTRWLSRYIPDGELSDLLRKLDIAKATDATGINGTDENFYDGLSRQRRQWVTEGKIDDNSTWYFGSLNDKRCQNICDYLNKYRMIG